MTLTSSPLTLKTGQANCRALFRWVELRHVFVGFGIELGEAILTTEFDGLTIMGEDVGLIAEVLTGNDAFG